MTARTQKVVRVRPSRRPFVVASLIFGLPMGLGLLTTLKNASAWNAVLVFGGVLLLSYAWLWRLELALGSNDVVTYRTLFKTTSVHLSDLAMAGFRRAPFPGRPRVLAHLILFPKPRSVAHAIVIAPRMFDENELKRFLRVLEEKTGVRSADD